MAVLKFPAALTFYSNSSGACGMFSCGHTNNEIVFRTNYFVCFIRVSSSLYNFQKCNKIMHIFLLNPEN